MNCDNAFWVGAKVRLTQHLFASSWERTLETGESQRPWDWAETWPIARLQHEPTGTDLFVLEGTDITSLAFGSAHMNGTGTPGLRARVISGHRDTHFRFLEEVQLRDELLLQHKDGKWQRYLVDSIEAANSEEDPLLLLEDQNRLFLITCFPFDNWVPGGPLRYVVRAKLAPHQHNV